MCAIVGAPLAIGSFQPAVVATFCGACLVAASLRLVAPSSSGRSSHVDVDIVAIALAVLALFTAIQLIPLPVNVLRALSPNGAEIWLKALSPLRADLSSVAAPLTLDPPATAFETLKFALVLTGYVLAYGWSRRSGALPALTTVAVAGIAAAIVSLAHRLVDAQLVYGFYAPVDGKGWPLHAPFINRNHLAGFLSLTMPVTVCVGLSEERVARRALWMVGAVVSGVALVLTLSRGGILSLAVGLAALFVFLLRARTKGGAEPRTLRFWVLAAGGIVLAAGALLAFDDILASFARRNRASKMVASLDALRMALSYPLAGIGRGAFTSAFPTFSTQPSHTFTHTENLPSQLLVDWGLVVGGAALVGLLALGVSLARIGSASVRNAGAVAGVIALGVHELGDFGIELIGVALPAAVVVAAVRGAHRHVYDFRLPRLATWAALASVAGGILLTPFASRASLRSDSHRVAALVEEHGTKTQAHAVLRQAMLHHPADYYLPYQAAIWAARTGFDDPVPWLNRSLMLNPNFGPTHLEAAQALIGMGRVRQALVEYRLGVPLTPHVESRKRITRALVAKSPTFDSLRGVARTRDEKLLMWELLAEQLDKQGFSAEAERADHALLEVDPGFVPALRRGMERAILRRDLDGALRLAARVRDRDPAEAALLTARVHGERGDPTAAAQALERELLATPDRRELLAPLPGWYERAGSANLARRALRRLEATAVGQEEHCATLFQIGCFEERAGRLAAAGTAFDRAITLCDGTDALEGRARIAEASGRFTAALEVYREIALRVGDERYASKVAALRTRMERDRRGTTTR